MTDFWEKVDRFNTMYKLPTPSNPTSIDPMRIIRFEAMLRDELDEVDAIIEERCLVDLADWLGDIMIYCATEARRHGLPMAQILDVIMESNFSKLGADGEPIYDERGKVMKGPNYWKPEPKIGAIIEEAMQ
jgi:hypothetical protein